jgi:hypothetical protein
MTLGLSARSLTLLVASTFPAKPDERMDVFEEAIPAHE